MMKMLGIVVCVNEDILHSCVNVFFLRQRNFYYTCLKGLKVSIYKKLKGEGGEEGWGQPLHIAYYHLIRVLIVGIYFK